MHRVLLALDGSSRADAAISMARTWMQQDSQLHVVMLYVTEILSGRFPGPRLPMSYEIEVAQQLQQRMKQHVFRAWPSRILFLHKTGPSVARVICQTAELLGCDTILLGGEPVHGLRRWLGDSVPPAVLTRTSASVFVVRSARKRLTPPLRLVKTSNGGRKVGRYEENQRKPSL